MLGAPPSWPNCLRERFVNGAVGFLFYTWTWRKIVTELVSAWCREGRPLVDWGQHLTHQNTGGNGHTRVSNRTSIGPSQILLIIGQHVRPNWRHQSQILREGDASYMWSSVSKCLHRSQRVPQDIWQVQGRTKHATQVWESTKQISWQYLLHRVCSLHSELGISLFMLGWMHG